MGIPSISLQFVTGDGSPVLQLSTRARNLADNANKAGKQMIQAIIEYATAFLHAEGCSLYTACVLPILAMMSHVYAVDHFNLHIKHVSLPTDMLMILATRVSADN